MYVANFHCNSLFWDITKNVFIHGWPIYTFLTEPLEFSFITRVWIFLELCINFRGNSYTIFLINEDLNNAIVRCRNVDDIGCLRFLWYSSDWW